MMIGPRRAAGTSHHQSPNTESNRRPSPYHGDALPTELLGRARKTLHAPPPIAEIRFGAGPVAGPRLPRLSGLPPAAPRPRPRHARPHRYDYCAPPATRPGHAALGSDSLCVILRSVRPAQERDARGARCPTASRSRPTPSSADGRPGPRPPAVRRPPHRRPDRGRTAGRRRGSRPSAPPGSLRPHAAAPRVDLGGYLLLPAPAEPHAHGDTALTADGAGPRLVRRPRTSSAGPPRPPCSSSATAPPRCAPTSASATCRGCAPWRPCCRPGARCAGWPT